MKKYTLFLFIFYLFYYPVCAYSQSNNTQEIFVTGLSVPVSSTRAGIGIDTITQEQIEAINPNTCNTPKFVWQTNIFKYAWWQ